MESLSKVTNYEILMFGNVIRNKVDLLLRYHHANTDIIFAVRPSANILKGTQLTLGPYMYFCVSSISE